MHTVQTFWKTATEETWKQMWAAKVGSIISNHPDWKVVGIISDNSGCSLERRSLRAAGWFDFEAHHWEWFQNQ